MAGKDLFDQRRSGAGHAEHKYRVAIGRPPTGATFEEISGQGLAQSRHKRAGLRRVVRQGGAAQTVAFGIASERGFIAARVLERLAQRETQLQAIVVAKIFAP